MLLLHRVFLYLSDITSLVIQFLGNYSTRLKWHKLKVVFLAFIISLVVSQGFHLGWGYISTQFKHQQFNTSSLPIELGYPRNLRLGEAHVSVGGGGYVTGIYFHPRQSDLIYIKTDICGFYRWNPSSQEWISLTDHFRLDESNYYGGESLAVDPQDPNVVYIAVGKYLYESGGLFKSTDQGRTWTKLPLDLPMGGNTNKRWIGERLAVSPHNSSVLFFGSRTDGLWRSNNAGLAWQKVDLFPGTLEAEIGISAVVFDQNTPGTLYANAYGDGLYESDDDGQTWHKLESSPSTIHQIAISSDRILYATTEHSPGVQKFLNGTWRNITPDVAGGIFDGSTSKRAFNGLSLNPINPEEILVTLDQTDNTPIYHSVDGGRTWTEIHKVAKDLVPWRSELLFANHIAAIAFDPHTTGRVWFTDWFGVWQTHDINAPAVEWTSAVGGQEGMVTFALVSPPQGALLVSGVADLDGFNHANGLEDYPLQNFGKSGPSFQDTYSIAYCETRPLEMVRVGGNRWNSTYGAAISHDGGVTWQAVELPTKQMPVRVAMSAANPDVFVVIVSEGQALWTGDRGRTWKVVEGLPDGVSGPWNWVQPLAADSVDGNSFYYYEPDSGAVYRSQDQGQSFAQIYTGLPAASWAALKVTPNHAHTIWVSTNTQGLYQSQDGGQTFSVVKSVEQAHLFAFGKPAPQSTTPALYVYGRIQGLGEGIFRSLDFGQTWSTVSHPQKIIGNNPNVMEASKQIFGLAFVGTNGRGIYYGSTE